MKNLSIDVKEEDNKQRLDVFLAKSLSDVPSRTFVKKIIEGGNVLVNGKKVKVHHKIYLGDKIEVEIPDVDDTFEDIKPEKIELDIFYEDSAILVINKPIGMLVHPTHNCQTGTLVNAVLYYLKERNETLSDINSNVRPGIVHRLDRDTSGLIIVAKDNVSHVRLSRQFEKHKIRKRYVALVKGDITFDEGIIDVPLGRHPGHWDKKSVSYDEMSKEAKTIYRVLKRCDKSKTLVALFPESGRTHQLRVHMAHIGHPILGDTKYGRSNSFPRMALHAQAIGFHHPQTRRYIEFFLPIPKEISGE